MEMDSKALKALRIILEEVDREDLYYQIVASQKSLREGVAYSVKSLLRDNKATLQEADVPTLRNLYELIAQIEDEELRTSIETLLDDLVDARAEKSIPGRIAQSMRKSKRCFKFDLHPDNSYKPKKFNWDRMSRRFMRGN